MEKKKVILSGPDLLTRSTIRWLKEVFQMTLVYHEINEVELSSLIQTLRPIDGLIHGGPTPITDLFFKRTPQIKWNIFPGMEPFPTYNRAALDYAKAHNILIYPTGGGIRAVAETTCQEISDPLLIRKRAAGLGLEVPFGITNFHRLDSLAVIGLGNLAKKILADCPTIKKFEQVCYSGRSEKPGFTAETGIPFKRMEKAFTSDIVVLSIAHIPEVTDNYIGSKLLQMVARHGVVINNIRPQIMNMAETIAFAKKRRDVTIIIDASRDEIVLQYGYNETLMAIDSCPNITLTGHTAWKKSYTRKEYSVGVRNVVTENNLA